MLLRASRCSSELTKRAGFGSAIGAIGKRMAGFGRGVRKAVKDPLGSIGSFAWKHKLPVAAGAAGVTTAGMGAAEGFRRASKGVEPPYPNVQTPGMYNF